MNERIAKLYDQSIVIELGRDYVCGELDPVKFAQLIVKECANRATWAQDTSEKDIGGEVLKHFGVEE